MDLTTKRNCPNCGLGVKNSILEVRAKFPAENQTANQLKDFFVGFRKDQCFFTYFRCICGILWCPEYFHQEALDEIYRNIPENTLVSGEKDSIKTQVGYVDLIFKLNQVNSPILEIGADLGSLIGEIVDRNSRIKAYAVEPNEKVYARLASRLSSKNNVYRKLSEFPSSIQPNLIVMVHVLDHLIEPRKFLENISSISSPVAELFIVVHNESSLLRKILRDRWVPFCLQHPQIFNIDTITSLLTRTKFGNIRSRRTYNWITPNQVGRILESISILPPRATTMLPNTAFPVKLGNFAVSAQKINFNSSHLTN